MKIAINYKLKTKSWGGGNQFVSSLINSAKQKDYNITFNLNDKDIDIILMIDPRSYNDDITFGSLDIIRYLFFINKNAIIIHRINECDERKNTRHINRLLRFSNYCADFTVFISSWLKNLDIYEKNKPSRVILNGADKNIFCNYGDNSWDGKVPLKIVTHHWSPNYMKGFDVYKEVDQLIDLPYWRNRIEFTYIGNLPKGFTFKNAKHIKPINGKLLGKELAKHNLYLSASINEPAGMHHIEGIMCGLPIIFRKSGALPEYCDNYGICFENKDFLSALNKMLEQYSYYKKKVVSYPNDAIKMTNEYLDLFSELINKRDKIIKTRNLFRSPSKLVKNLIFIFLEFKVIVRFLYKKFVNFRRNI